MLLLQEIRPGIVMEIHCTFEALIHQILPKGTVVVSWKKNWKWYTCQINSLLHQKQLEFPMLLLPHPVQVKICAHTSVAWNHSSIHPSLVPRPCDCHFVPYYCAIHSGLYDTHFFHYSTFPVSEVHSMPEWYQGKKHDHTNYTYCADLIPRPSPPPVFDCMQLCSSS